MGPFVFLCILFIAWIQVGSEPTEVPARKHGGGNATGAYIRQMCVETFEQNGSNFTS